jgi:hypothetical protein
MKTFVLIVCVLALAIPTLAAAQKAKEPFTASVVQLDKTVDVTAFKTYSWTPGHPSLLPSVDKVLVAAIDAQMAAKGLTKADKGDVLVCYHSVERQDVDLKTFDEKAPAAGAERPMAQMVRVGSLVIDLKNPATNKLIWRVKGEGVTSNLTDANRAEFLNAAVAKLFTLYPAAPAKKK